jgi:hypothetical protein
MGAFLIPVRGFCALATLLFGANAFAALAIPNDAQATTPPGGYRIAGTVVSKTDGHALARARICLKDSKDPQKFQSLVTAEDGKFQFIGLAAGKYLLEGERRGFVSASYDQHDQFSTAIVTGAGLDTESLMLRLAPDAVITGKVLDEVGEPARRATVTLYYDDHSAGIDEINQFRSAQTDDEGVYEIAPVKPGTYFLSASATPWYAVHASSESERQGEATGAFDRSLDVTYPVTYYADVSESDSATPIPVRGGERVQVDVHLNPVPAIRILFHVPTNGQNAVTFPQLQQPAFDGSINVQAGGGNVVSPGIIEITGIPAGRYNVLLRTPGSGRRMDGVDLTKDGGEIDASGAEALCSVKISVQLLGKPALPSGLTIGLRSGRRGSETWQSTDPKGRAEFLQIAAGRHEIFLRSAGNSYSIAHISAEGAELSGHTLTLATGSSPSVSLILAGGNVELQGTAKREGNPFAGAMVILVPKNPEMNPDLFRRDQSALDGTFSLRDVIPGSYTVLALENGWDLDWARPNVIGAYLKHGEGIEVGNQGGRTVDLTEPIEVSSK